MRNFVILILFPGLMHAGTAQIRDAAEVPDFAGARKVIREMMVAGAVPSIAVAVVRNGRILWEEGFGWADR